MLAADIEILLLDWSRWCRSCGHRRGQANSVEGNYRSPQHWKALTDVPVVPINPDRVRAAERAVVALQDPWKLAITMHYLRGMPDDVLRRILIRRWRIGPEPVLAEARRRVGDALQRHDQHVGRAQVAQPSE
jgi:hypothetical protein